MEDTIAAISTALGVGAISIIRVSGNDSIKIVNEIFKGKDLTKQNTHTIHYGYIVDNEKIIDEVKKEKNITYDTELTVEDLKELVNRFKKVYSDHMNGEEFPQDPKEQLMGAVKAVFRSWDNPRAIVYRRMKRSLI